MPGESHVGYEQAEEWPISFDKGGWEPAQGIQAEVWFQVEDRDMRHPGKARDKDQSRITYNNHITIQSIPAEVYDYMVNGKPAIVWVMIRQRVKTDKTSQIVNDTNRFAIETMKDPAYPLRLLAKVITVSMETLKIAKKLSGREFFWDRKEVSPS